ncbi:MAG: tetratricopeptide repeat protein [Bacteroidaceae bacterium]|nr:tetratricopeptide repeat protein [Bacteroidaceae bacterium]
MRLVLLLTFLIPAFLTLSPAKKAKEEKPKQPKQERLATLYKNARNALKNQSGQDAARDALLSAVTRPELGNRQKAKIYYKAALLEQSLNGEENKKAFLKQAFDSAKFFNKLRDMYGQLHLCDSVDVLPDAKGNMHPRYQNRSRALRLKHRRNILNGGKFFLAKKDYASAYPFLDLYCTHKDPNQKDSLYPQTQLWATLAAFQAGNYEGTVKHADAAIPFADANTAPILHEYKVRSYGKLRNDSAWTASLKDGVIRYPDHDWFFVQLSDWCYRHRRFDVERQLADRLIAQTGGKAIHYYAKSKSYLSEEEYEASIASADTAIAIQPDFADAYYNKGIAYLNMAVIAQETSPKDAGNPDYLSDKTRIQAYYRQALPCMETVRKLQPDRQDRWASPLYRIYLNLNMGDEFNEIDKLLNQKQ